MRAYRDAPLAVPPFLQVPLKLFKATGEERVRLSLLCGCGEQPKQLYRCPRDGNEYTVGTIPLKGYKVGKEVIPVGSPDDIEAARAGGPIYDSLGVQAVVPLKSVVKRFDFGDAYYCLPDPSEPDITFRQFALFAAVLDVPGDAWAMFGRLTFNSLPRRLAVVSVDGVLIAETLAEKRDLPYDVRARLPTPNPAEVEQLRAFLKTLYRE